MLGFFFFLLILIIAIHKIKKETETILCLFATHKKEIQYPDNSGVRVPSLFW